MKKLLNVILNFFSKKKAVQNATMTVYHVDDSDMLHIAMGISEKRFQELSKIINETYAPGKNLIQMMSDLSKECRDPQELALVMFVYGCATEKLKNPLFWEKYV